MITNEGEVIIRAASCGEFEWAYKDFEFKESYSDRDVYQNKQEALYWARDRLNDIIAGNGMSKEAVEARIKAVEEAKESQREKGPDKVPAVENGPFSTLNELLRIIEAALQGDTKRVRAYAEFLANKVEYIGNNDSAQRIRRVVEEDGKKVNVVKDKDIEALLECSRDLAKPLPQPSRIATLEGKVEELTAQVNKLQTELTDLKDDTEETLDELEMDSHNHDND